MFSFVLLKMKLASIYIPTWVPYNVPRILCIGEAQDINEINLSVLLLLLQYTCGYPVLQSHFSPHPKSLHCHSSRTSAVTNLGSTNQICEARKNRDEAGRKVNSSVYVKIKELIMGKQQYIFRYLHADLNKVSSLILYLSLFPCHSQIYQILTI